MFLPFFLPGKKKKNKKKLCPCHSSAPTQYGAEQRALVESESSLQDESGGAGGATAKFPLMQLAGTVGEILHACGRHRDRAVPTCWIA